MKKYVLLVLLCTFACQASSAEIQLYIHNQANPTTGLVVKVKEGWSNEYYLYPGEFLREIIRFGKTNISISYLIKKNAFELIPDCPRGLIRSNLMLDIELQSNGVPQCQSRARQQATIL